MEQCTLRITYDGLLITCRQIDSRQSIVFSRLVVKTILAIVVSVVNFSVNKGAKSKSWLSAVHGQYMPNRSSYHAPRFHYRLHNLLLAV